MVVTVCPTTLNVDETLFALQFATRARNISLGPAHKNVGAKNLLEEGKGLRAKLREAGRKKVTRKFPRISRDQKLMNTLRFKEKLRSTL